MCKINTHRSKRTRPCPGKISLLVPHLLFKSWIVIDVKMKGIPRMESKLPLIYFSDGKVPF